ncbi:MAG TPA: EcsC family protein [Intrasporangiaceae bacterium]|nr:EcsC family protein [Intrasporangiaceae bacterium]
MARKKKAVQQRSALEQAQHPDGGFLGGTATSLVQSLLEAGIDGKGPFDSAEQVAREALGSEGSVEKAVAKVISAHTRLAAVEGFLTGLGGFITLPVALPANVLGFYLLATRQAAAIAYLRGYSLADPQIRSAVLLSLVGSDGDELLKKAGVVAPTSAMTNLAAQRLPGPALMVVNKAVGFRLLTQVGKRSLTRLGKAIPLAGGVIGAGLDGFLMRSVAKQARQEFPAKV